MRDLKALIQETREGNVRAFGYVVRRFHGMAVGYAFSILKDFYLAEDAAQEAFILAFSRLDQLARDSRDGRSLSGSGHRDPRTRHLPAAFCNEHSPPGSTALRPPEHLETDAYPIM